MLWGGTVLVSDTFTRACDRLGVWFSGTAAHANRQAPEF